MRIHIDPERCQGHSRCIGIAPELFDIDEFGLATIRSDQAIPEVLVAKARLAISNCPEYAISQSGDQEGME